MFMFSFEQVVMKNVQLQTLEIAKEHGFLTCFSVKDTWNATTKLCKQAAIW